MRTQKIFLTFLMLMSFMGVRGQEYVPLLENNKTFDVLKVLYVPNENFYDTTYSTIRYKLMGDTLINSYSYIKLYKSNENHPENWTLDAYLREDTQKKVWFLDDNFNEEEVLLYDFGVSQGDVVDVGIGESTQLSVDSIAEVEIDGVLRHKYWLSSDDDYKETWVTGIGSNKGLLCSGSSHLIGGWYWLLCVSDMEGLIYLNPSYESCYLTMDNIPENLSKPLHVYPNPATSKITFDLPVITKKSFLIIKDICGKTITEIPLEKGQKQLIWDCSHIISGMYFFQIKVDELKYSGKVLIQ